MKTLWTPETALRRADYTRIGGHHIAVRMSEVPLFSEATQEAIQKATQKGKVPPDRTPQVMGVWPGALWSYPEVLSPTWATLCLYQAPRMRNQPIGALEAFEFDRKRLKQKPLRGVLPLLIVTDISHTGQWANVKQAIPDTGFFDPNGPEQVQRSALNEGICVVRTTQDELPTLIPELMSSLHLGKHHHRVQMP